jgi:tRNA pseudouridine38-40 synthase
MGLEYEGTRYHGFAVQPAQLTIQAAVEGALQRVLGHPVRVTPAGRTDSGVHARGQVISFATDAQLPAGRIGRALNALLPPDIVAGPGEEAGAGFDARRGARRRHYRYSVWNGERPNLWCGRYSCHLTGSLDEENMNIAAGLLVGRRDFASFVGHAAQQPIGSSSVRTLESARWSRDGDMLHFDCSADAFARHMVRNIVGTLLWVGRGRLSPSDVTQVVAVRDRRAAGPTAPARGLTFMNVDYDDRESHS